MGCALYVRGHRPPQQGYLRVVAQAALHGLEPRIGKQALLRGARLFSPEARPGGQQCTRSHLADKLAPTLGHGWRRRWGEIRHNTRILGGMKCIMSL
ncbi:hypothetical protein D3C72_1627440 [compost metagenome]